MKRSFKRTALICLVVWFGSFMNINAEPDQPVTIDKLLADSETLSVSVEKTGAQLLAILKDQTRPSKMRVRCALALGELKYQPAIPELIRQLLLYPGNDNGEAIIFTEATLPPCVQALSKYGNAATSEIINAYMKEDDEYRRLLLSIVVAKAKAKDMAIAYAKGLSMDSKDAMATKRVQELIGLFDKMEKKHAPPPLPK